MLYRLRLTSLILALAVSPFPIQALATSFSVSAIDPPVSVSTFVYAINDSGMIVGSYSDPSQIVVQDSGCSRPPCVHRSGGHGFSYVNGTFTTIDHPGAEYNSVRGVNNLGQMVGNYGGDSDSHGFLFSGGSFTTIPNVSGADGINDAGDIVGTIVSDHLIQGYVLHKGIMTLLYVPGGIGTRAFAINNLGDIVGYYVAYIDASHTHTASFGFLYRKGSFTLIPAPTPSTREFQPYGINDAGVISGDYLPDIAVFDSETSHGVYGFLLSSGVDGPLTRLDLATNGTGTIAWGINNRGQVVGYTGGRIDHGFVATPESPTTTTTLGGVQCDHDQDCDDGGVCSRAVCRDRRCERESIGGIRGLECQLGGLRAGPLCTDSVPPRFDSRIRRQIRRAQDLVDRIAGAKGKRRKRLRGALDRHLGAVGRAVTKAGSNGTITLDCAGSIHRSLVNLRADLADIT
jgi:uncharacterized membrane protein